MASAVWTASAGVAEKVIVPPKAIGSGVAPARTVIVSVEFALVAKLPLSVAVS